MKLCYRVAIGTIVLASVVFCLATAAQDEPGARGRARWADQPHVAGAITAIRPNVFEVQTQDGKSATVKVSSDTMFRKNRAPAKFSDFKVGDTILAMGEQQKDGSLSAKIVASGFGGAGGGAPGGPVGGMSPEDLGKKFIMGEVTKIDETKLTILRTDKVEQVIEADENTSFRNDKGESVTLADIKVGDFVGGRGELKSGTFVPQVLRIGLPPQRRGDRNPNHPPDQKSDSKSDSKPDQK